jgi:glyoxylase-like metal-dependent hydrolase (beta-lactamase superfamily II)
MATAQIRVLDLEFRGTADAVAAFLVSGPAGHALVECGPGSTVPTLQRALAAHGLQPADISDVFLTHIHLDHAGSAGWWSRQGARIHVHAFGAPHLLDPSKLLASATRIYGDQMDVLWGDFLPVVADRLHAYEATTEVEAAGLRFRLHDTPGHARHHFVVQVNRFAFTGDLAAIRIQGRPHTRLPTPPPEFDAEAWQGSLTRMHAERFERLYLTHFGAVEGVDAVAAQWARVGELIMAYTDAGRETGEREALIARLTEIDRRGMDSVGLSDHDRARYDNAGAMAMSADGVLRYWRKRVAGGTS